jgi:hypothetical protein
MTTKAGNEMPTTQPVAISRELVLAEVLPGERARLAKAASRLAVLCEAK